MADGVEVERLYADLFEAAAAGRRLGDEIAALAGQTQARWQTLWTIGAAPLTAPQIARRLGVSRQHILRLTNELGADGLTRQVANPDHKTSPLIELTAAGRETLAAINARADESNRALQSELTDADLARLRRLLQRFTAIVASTRVR